jgi:hypothetical protein
LFDAPTKAKNAFPENGRRESGTKNKEADSDENHYEARAAVDASLH